MFKTVVNHQGLCGAEIILVTPTKEFLPVGTVVGFTVSGVLTYGLSYIDGDVIEKGPFHEKKEAIKAFLEHFGIQDLEVLEDLDDV